VNSGWRKAKGVWDLKVLGGEVAAMRSSFGFGIGFGRENMMIAEVIK